MRLFSIMGLLGLMILGTMSVSSRSVLAQAVDREFAKGIVYNADEIDFDQKEQLIKGKGNVKVTYQNLVMTADEIVIDLRRKKAFAEGRVKIVQDDKIVEGEDIIYDFATREIEMDDLRVQASPWYVYGDTVDRHKDGQVSMTGGYCSTCNLAQPHWRLKTKQLIIYPGDKIVAKNVTVYIGKMPIFFWPHYAHSLKDKRGKFIIVPGRNSDWGTYALTGYRYEVGEGHKGTVKVDYRQDKGFAYGLDHEYIQENYSGLLRLYYLDERNSSLTPMVEKERYRAKWTHQQKFTDDLWSVIEWNEMKDGGVVKDYFQREFENNPEPESYVFTQYDMERSNISLLAKPQTNKSFDTVEALPQVKYHSTYVNLGDVPVYVKTEAQAANLNRESLTNTNSTQRVDLLHEYWMSEKVGFVGIRPYIGTRQTYYSKDLADEDELRGVFRSGVSFNTKLYKTIDYENDAWDIHGLRVVHEPTIEFRFQDDPTVKPSDLEPFDSIDQVDYQNYVQFKIENRLQTKRSNKQGSKNWNLLQHRLYVNYYAKGSVWGGSKRDISEIYEDFEIRPVDWLTLDIETLFDPYEKRYNSIETDFVFQDKSKPYGLTLGHHYRRDLNDEIISDLRFGLGEKWKVSIMNNYDLRADVMSRQQYTVMRDMHCWTSSFTYARKRDNFNSEDEFWVSFQLKAFDDDPNDLTDGLQGQA